MVLSRNDSKYRQCSRSVMDNIADPDINFDENGVSNYCHEYEALVRRELPTGAERERRLDQLISDIKNEGKGKKYDCITGVSGGVDSSYLIYKAKEWGLRPLIVHFDNGWNSEIAVHNINRIIQATGFDLYTIVVNWEEFRDLQLAYLKAGVVDLEVPTDHAIYATWYKLAEKYNVNIILDGNNIVTEAILPRSWIFNKADHVNLLAIHKKFGTIPLKTYPIFGFKAKNIQTFFKGVKSFKPLDLVNYNKQVAKKTIQREFGWTDYGGKHYESVYTKFYQAYILPNKYKIDKRKAHLSNLILSGQITRAEALEELARPLYQPGEAEKEKIYVLKKLGLSNDEFEYLMQMPPVPHEVYGTQKFLTEQYPFLKILKPVARVLAGFRARL